MEAIKWSNPHRKRNIHAAYTDPDYVQGYDIDLQDFAQLVNKLRNNLRLTSQENDRYGIYILSIVECVLEGPKWRAKTHDEKFEMRDQMYYEMLFGLPHFDPSKGSIYSYAYRIAYVAAVHYFKEINNKRKKDTAIEDHCYEELQYYLDEFITHKVNTNEHN